MSDTRLRDRLSWLLRDAETTVDADTDQDAVFIANLSLAGFRDTLQQAMAALSRPALEGMPVAWSLDGFICDDDGRAIGTDETQIHWGSENPDPDEGWQPLYAAPAPAQQAWQPIESAPKDGTYLVANAMGHVAPWINGVIHNNVGTANDWHYGEAATHWQPLPNPPAPNAAGDTPPATQENK